MASQFQTATNNAKNKCRLWRFATAIPMAMFDARKHQTTNPYTIGSDAAFFLNALYNKVPMVINQPIGYGTINKPHHHESDEVPPNPPNEDR